MYSVNVIVCDYCGSETPEDMWDGSWSPRTDMAMCSQCEYDLPNTYADMIYAERMGK